MNELLNRLHANGIQVNLSGRNELSLSYDDKIVASLSDEVYDSLISEIKAHKQNIVAFLGEYNIRAMKSIEACFDGFSKLSGTAIEFNGVKVVDKNDIHMWFVDLAKGIRGQFFWDSEKNLKVGQIVNLSGKIVGFYSYGDGQFIEIEIASLTINEVEEAF